MILLKYYFTYHFIPEYFPPNFQTSWKNPHILHRTAAGFWKLTRMPLSVSYFLERGSAENVYDQNPSDANGASTENTKSAC